MKIRKINCLLLACVLFCLPFCSLTASAAQTETTPESKEGKIDNSVYQLWEDYESGRYTVPVIEDESFRPELFFGPDTSVLRALAEEQPETIYQVKAVEGKKNEYVVEWLH